MLSLTANTHDVGRSLVDAVYDRHGTYPEHCARLNSQPQPDPLDGFVEAIGLRFGDQFASNAEIDAAHEAWAAGDRRAPPAPSLLHRLRDDLAMALAAALFALGMPLGMAVLMGVRL